MRHAVTTATVAVLLVTSGGAVGAQEASPEPATSPTAEQLAEAEQSPSPDCIVLGTMPPIEKCGDEEPIEALPPIADYWTRWADHKQIFRGRAQWGINNAKRATRNARFYRQLVRVHDDELTWLANHRPAACYRDEYEEWRSAVEDLRSIHKRAVRLARAGKTTGLARVGKQERAATRRLDKLLARVADCGPTATPTTVVPPSRDPFVGTWVTRDNIDVQEDGFIEQGRVTMRIDGNGSYLLRRPKAGYCRTLGHGYVPLTIQGSGEYSAEDGHRLYTSGRMYCWPKRGGRQFILGTNGEWWYHPSHDVLARDRGCFWRKDSGSPANCRTFYRGLPLPAVDDPLDETGAPRAED